MHMLQNKQSMQNMQNVQNMKNMQNVQNMQNMQIGQREGSRYQIGWIFGKIALRLLRYYFSGAE